MSPQTSAADFLCKEFCDAFSSVFEQTAGTAYALAKSDIARTSDPSDVLGYILEFKGDFSGSILVQVERSSAAVLATRFMGSPVDESVSYLPEHEDALFEIVNQTAGGMATSLRTRFGAAEIGVERSKGPDTTSLDRIMLRPADGGDSVSVELSPNQAILDSIAAKLSVSIQSAPQQSSSVQPGPETSSENQNLRLIMDVELDLTLRFGQRILMLSEIADLTSGAVVELDRMVEEPVELLLGERVIARGEVVIVDGNYGLRVTELTSIDPNTFLTA